MTWHRHLLLVLVAPLATVGVPLLVAALGQTAGDGPSSDKPAPAATDKAAAQPAGQWLPGDMHSHISPPDAPPRYDHAKSDLEGAIAAAKAGGLKWLVITPHAMDRTNEKTGHMWAADMKKQLTEREAAPDDPLVVLGWERTYAWPGHVTVSFADLGSVCGKPLGTVLQEVARQRGLAIVAHPFDDGVLLGSGNRSWRPWAGDARGSNLDPWLSGLEIRHPTSPAAAATRRWDEWIAAEQRRIIGVGATDDHWGTLYPTTWVWIEGELTPEKLHEALRAGRIVVGSDAAAGSLRVTSHRTGGDGAPPAAGPGDAVQADQAITIRWAGKARVFIDGRLLASRDGPVTHKIEKGSFHWVRLEVGISSYSSPVYVNLPPVKKPEAPPTTRDSTPPETRDRDAETKRPARR